MIGGVCGGIGKHLGIDPTLIRLVWAAAIFIYGTGLLLYILAWIIIPEE
jgi:phage shock protein PspC (stress-responsive transcriptional regulator)